MRDKSRHHDEVNIAFTKDLIGDAYIAVFGITSSYWFHMHPLLFGFYREEFIMCTFGIAKKSDEKSISILRMEDCVG
jgi:hypothetical protein